MWSCEDPGFRSPSLAGVTLRCELRCCQAAEAASVQVFSLRQMFLELVLHTCSSERQTGFGDLSGVSLWDSPSPQRSPFPNCALYFSGHALGPVHHAHHVWLLQVSFSVVDAPRCYMLLILGPSGSSLVSCLVLYLFPAGLWSGKILLVIRNRRPSLSHKNAL